MRRMELGLSVKDAIYIFILFCPETAEHNWQRVLVSSQGPNEALFICLIISFQIIYFLFHSCL